MRRCQPLSRTAGEGGERSEPVRVAPPAIPSPSRRFAAGPSLSRGAGEGLNMERANRPLAGIIVLDFGQV